MYAIKADNPTVFQPIPVDVKDSTKELPCPAGLTDMLMCACVCQCVYLFTNHIQVFKNALKKTTCMYTVLAPSIIGPV